VISILYIDLFVPQIVVTITLEAMGSIMKDGKEYEQMAEER
jgi:hypothetical protein